MSLTWQIDNVVNSDKHCWEKFGDGDPSISRKTDLLIWATMLIGMSCITEENWREFYTRMQLEPNQDCRRYYTGSTSRVYINAEDVRNHIGLSTNANNLSRAEWVKKVFEDKLKDV